MTSSPRVSLPLALLLVLTAGSLAYLIYFGADLPPRMAVRFTSAGEPDGWMDRLKFIVIAASVSFMLPPFIVACVGVMPRVLPVSLVNLPNRDHWLAPVRRETTLRFLLTAALWLGCIVEGFIVAIIVLVARANPPIGAARLSGAHVAVVAIFLVAVGVWVWQLVRGFARPAV
jgi:hypothetical protein